MAEYKKSFVLYADLIHTVKLMPEEKAGQLLLMILQYVNDENPESNDLVTAIAFEPIKRQLKRDLTEWESERAQRSVSGRNGGIKSGESRRSKRSTPSIIEGNVSSPSKNEANEAVTVTDTVTVNVNVNERLLIPRLEKIWLKENTTYPSDRAKDYVALGEISRYLAGLLNLTYDPRNEKTSDEICTNWELMTKYIVADGFFKSYSLQQVSKHFQNIIQSQINGPRNNKTSTGAKRTREQAISEW